MENEFFIEKQKAVERMKEMQNRSRQNGGIPPAPFFVSTDRGSDLKGNTPPRKSPQKPPDNPSAPPNNAVSSLLSSLGLSEGADGDVSLLLGLFLLLCAEDADRLLLYALLYLII